MISDFLLIVAEHRIKRLSITVIILMLALSAVVGIDCQLVQAASITIRPTEQLPQVVIRDNFIQLATAKIQEVLAENGETRHYEIEAAKVPAGVRLPVGDITYEVLIPNGIRYGSMMMVQVNININGRFYNSVRCSMIIHVFEKMVTAGRQLRPDKTIAVGDLRIEEREVKGLNYKYFTSIDQVAGHVVKRALAEGSIIYRPMLRNPIVFIAGTNVTIIGRVNGIEVKTDGIAKGDGRVDEYVQVLNPQSGRLLRAKVVDENTVLIEK